MSAPDPSRPGKFTRLRLFLPIALLLLAVAGWSGFWVYARSEAAQHMDRAIQALQAAGWSVGWRERQVRGYPFRLSLRFTDLTVRNPENWALQAPVLEAEAYLHAPGHWMLAAPGGLTFTRPLGGPVAVTGRVIRASLKDLDRKPPSFSFQGTGLTFTPGAGANPFALASAELVEFHLRPGPDDEGGVFLLVKGGRGGPQSLLGRIAAGKPVAAEWNATLSRMSAFSGAGWPEAARAWTAAGGRMTVRNAGLGAGDATAQVGRGDLGVGSEGRLAGDLQVTLRDAPRVLAILAGQGAIPPEAADAATALSAARAGSGGAMRASINFQAGRATLGPVALGDAPRVVGGR